MTLTELERQSAVWTKVSEELNSRLTSARLRNDGELNEIETARLRGQIFVLKSLLALGDKPGPMPMMEDDE